MKIIGRLREIYKLSARLKGWKDNGPQIVKVELSEGCV